MASTTRRTTLRQQREEARAKIVAAAEDALRSRPFRDVSVDEVMQSAGLARTLFYRHFDDLADLALRVAAPAFEDLLSVHTRGAEDAPLTEASLREAIAQAVSVFADHGPLIRAISEAASHDQHVETVYAGVVDRYVALTARLLERTGAPDAHDRARALTVMNVAYLIDAFGGDQRITEAEAVAMVMVVWTPLVFGG